LGFIWGMSKTMRCAIRRGACDIVFSNNEPVPVPTKGTVRLKVKAASLNPIDFKMPKMSLGRYNGCDVAGVVDEVHPSVKNFSVGDEVYGVAQFGKSGGIAEYCLCEAKLLGRKPQDLDFAKAAGCVVSYITSYGALTDKAKAGMEEGDSVLVIGASGGCGLAGVQLAKALGAKEVVGLCSKANHDLVMSHGATRCVDYGDPEAYAAMLERDRFDVVLDTVTAAEWRALGNKGTNYWPDGRKMLSRAKKGRRHVSTSGSYGQWFKTIMGLSGPQKVVFMDLSNVEADLGRIHTILGGSAYPHIDMQPPLTEAGLKEGLDRIRSRRARGKIVFSMADPPVDSPPLVTPLPSPD